VLVQNRTKGTTVTVPEGNTLNLIEQTNAIADLNAGNADFMIFQNAITGKFTLKFYTQQSGIMQMAVYALDGRTVINQVTHLEVGNNVLELSLPTGVYVVRLSGTGYAYSTELLSLKNAVVQARAQFLGNETAVRSFSKSKVTAAISMYFTAGDQLLYTATSDPCVASVPDVPTCSKTIHFGFHSLPTTAIPAGTFTMGSPPNEAKRATNETPHTVTLSAFCLSKYEITNAQYAAFLNAKNIGGNGLYADGIYHIPLIYPNSSWGLTYNGTQWVPVAGYENSPVINVTWCGANEFAHYLGGSLPTEAQWEYACRAGSSTPFNTGNYLTNSQANYNWAFPYNAGINAVTASPDKPQPVGTYAPNAYGLYDMHGNVAEWCSDLYNVYPATDQYNPIGVASSSLYIVRGGSWDSSAENCRSAFRKNATSYSYEDKRGFRVAFNQPDSLDQPAVDNRFVGKPSTSLIMTRFDSIRIIALDRTTIYYKIDVDSDKVADFRVSTLYGYSSGGASTMKTDIKVLADSTDISSVALIDTTYICSYYNYPIYYTKSSGYVSRSTSLDTISSIATNYYPKVYAANDTLNENAVQWSNQTLVLSYRNDSGNNYRQNHIENGIWNNTHMKYLLFRKIKGGELHYGWIKLSITDHTDITLYQYACQK
jgi:formylglycine-generating enzyme required for sulfatase activity